MKSLRRLALIFTAILATNSCRTIPESYYVASAHIHSQVIHEEIEIVLGESRVIINATLYEPKNVCYYKHYTLYQLNQFYIVHYPESGVMILFRYDYTKICTIIKMEKR